MNEHTHDAWVLGLHELPEDAPPLHQFGAAGNVIVHDLSADEWQLLTHDAFEDEFEWVPEDEPED